MAEIVAAASTELQSVIDREGFAFVRAASIRELLAPFGSVDDWKEWSDSWNRLELDTYMADGGRYRKRRYGVFAADAGTIVREPHQPHYQTRNYNPLNGGVDRWFAPIEDRTADAATMRTILGFCHALFGALAQGTRRWHVEVHQFRIEARAGEEGRPAPEGVHRDGVDYVLVLLVNRRNIASGVTSIHSLDGRQLGEFTLTDPFDAAVVDDSRVAHGVTPVEPLDARESAYRDVLVVTFRAVT